jgi:hypothetical protein
VDLSPDDIRRGLSLFEKAVETGHITETMLAEMRRGERLVLLLPKKCATAADWARAQQAHAAYVESHSLMDWARAKAATLELLLTEDETRDESL